MKGFLASIIISVVFLAGCQSSSSRYDIKAHFGECPINGQLCKICERSEKKHESKAAIEEQDQSEPVWNRILNRGVMVVGVKADTPPFSVMNDDGSFWGFEVDLLSALAEEMGVEFKMIPVNAKQRIPYLLQNKVDLVMATMTLTKKRDAFIDFSTPYFQVGQGLIVSKRSRIQGFRNLKGKKVAVLEGTQAFHTLARIQPDCQLTIVSSYDEGLDKVIAGEVSALCSDHLILMGLLHNHKTPEKIALVEQTFAPDTYAIAMRENESSLRDAVNSALMVSWEEGIWPDAFDTWFGPGSMYSHDSTFSIRLVPE